MAQAPAFTGMPEGVWAATAVCALATLGDAVLVLLLWGIGALLFRDPRWFVAPAWATYVPVVLVAIAAQVTLEWVMVYRFHRWGYSPGHPLVPGLRVGALPTLQAALLPPLIFWLAGRWQQRAAARRHERDD
jgi:hypothetical protein